MKSLRKAYRGEKGFTLVELLVVVVILGVLAAVATLAVTRFIGSGNLESANAELHQAITAVTACMAEAGVSQLDATGFGDWAGETGTIEATGAGGTVYDAAASLRGVFKATYTVNQNGEITNAVPLATGGWTGIQWNATTLNWEAIP